MSRTFIAIIMMVGITLQGFSQTYTNSTNFSSKPAEEKKKEDPKKTSYEKGAIKIISKKGPVLVIHEPSKKTLSPEESGVGQIISQKHLVRTGPFGKATLQMGNGARVTILPKSELHIQEFLQKGFKGKNVEIRSAQKEPTTSRCKLRINYGQLAYTSRPLNSQSRCHIETPIGTAGIRGTTFQLEFINNKVTILATEGKVVFTDKMNNTTPVPNNKEWSLSQSTPADWPRVAINIPTPGDVQTLNSIVQEGYNDAKGITIIELVPLGDPNAPDSVSQAGTHKVTLRASELYLKPLPISGKLSKKTKDGGEFEATFEKAFSLAQFEVTQDQFKRVMGYNPSKFKGSPNLPVESVTWAEAVEFCQRLTNAERQAGRLSSRQEYRLPTEAEWEYACSAGSTKRFYFGDNPTHLVKHAWLKMNASKTTHPVGQKQANEFGLFDMYGNVFEWCSDWYGEYPNKKVVDYTGPADGVYKVQRGGNWFIDDKQIGSSVRAGNKPSHKDAGIGFRVCFSEVD